MAAALRGRDRLRRNKFRARTSQRPFLPTFWLNIAKRGSYGQRTCGSTPTRLFGVLAVIEFAWSAAVMLLEKADLQSWTSALVRKIMWIGAFYMLLLNGSVWIPAIIDSFNQIGATAAGVPVTLSPGDIFAQGLTNRGCTGRCRYQRRVFDQSRYFDLDGARRAPDRPLVHSYND